MSTAGRGSAQVLDPAHRRPPARLALDLPEGQPRGDDGASRCAIPTVSTGGSAMAATRPSSPISDDRTDRSRAHLAWIDALPVIQIDAHRVYVHAGVDPAVPIVAQADKTLLWKRYPSHDEDGHGDKHVVHGHDPNVHGPLQLVNRTDLDTLAWRTGRLVVGVFDDARAGGPIELIEVRGPQAPPD